MVSRDLSAGRQKSAEKNKRKRIIFLVGPTALGKSEIAALLAGKINAEILSCDSMQIYKGMDILTSKPSSLLKKKVRHHLIDLISPDKEYNVYRYRREAMRKIKQIINKGKIPLFVGGTGLYMSVVIDGIFSIKTENSEIRQRLEKEAQKFGNGHLHKKLERIDPLSAARIHLHDRKRMIRALEVFEATGRPISEWQKKRKGTGDKYDIRIFCLDMNRERLYDRINQRVDKMFKKGLVKEAKRLLKLKLSRTASYAIGVRELKGYFDGLYNLEVARELIRRNTRWYAKRQLTWFRKDKRIEWLQIKDKETAQQIAHRLGTVLLAQ